MKTHRPYPGLVASESEFLQDPQVVCTFSKYIIKVAKLCLGDLLQGRVKSIWTLQPQKAGSTVSNSSTGPKPGVPDFIRVLENEIHKVCFSPWLVFLWIPAFRLRQQYVRIWSWASINLLCYSRNCPRQPHPKITGSHNRTNTNRSLKGAKTAT